MIICSNCQQPSEESAIFCGYCGARIETDNQSNASKSQAFVNIPPESETNAKTDSVAEAQIVLTELESKREKLALDQKKLIEQEHQIRADHAAELENRENPFQGSENAGRFVRVLQSASREAAQRNLEHKLAPSEEQLRKIEAMQSELEQQISEVKSFILENSPES